jgi:hypothetical protein
MHWTKRTAMRPSTVAFALLACPALVACGEEAGLSFGALQGSYGWSEDGFSCEGRVSGSSVEGSCDGVEVDAEFEDFYERRVTRITIEGTLSDSSIAAKVVHSVDYTAWYQGECWAGSEVTTYDGSGTKSSGLSGTGPFAAMAGNWSATVAADQVMRDGRLDSSKDDCVAGRSVPATKSTAREVTTWTSSCILTAQTGTITRTRASSDYWEYDDDGSTSYHDHNGVSDYSQTTTLTASPSGDIVADGYLVDKL